MDDAPRTNKPKLAVVVGATGNQGGSVARRFLRAGFRVRGLTRDTTSPAAQQLAALGAEMVRVDLLADADADALRDAFRGASVIFSVTNYWEPFVALSPDRAATAASSASMAPGTLVRQHAGERERAAGRNIADAAAAAMAAGDTLDAGGFVASTLSHARRCSGGRIGALHHFDAKAEVFPDYVRARHPALAAKMRCVQTGFFMSSHRILPESYLAKVRLRFLGPCTQPTALPSKTLSFDLRLGGGPP